MQIEDGTTTRIRAKVDDENRLHVDALIKTAEHQANHREGKSFVVNFEATPAGAGDCFFYMKNTDEMDMVVEGVSLFLPASEYFLINVNDTGSPSGGNDITPVNLNSGSGNEAQGTFQHGNDLTGLVAGSVAYKINRLSTEGQKYYNFEQDIILRKNGVLTLYVQTGTTALTGFFDIFYHDDK